MDLKILHDKQEIYNFLIKKPELQSYLIGDLDDFFWPKTIWFSGFHDSEIKSVAMLYIGNEPPTLLAFGETGDRDVKELIKNMKPYLPGKFFVHLSPGLADVFGTKNIIEHFGLNIKMALHKNPLTIPDENIRFLNSYDIDKIEEFYKIAYPDNWFNTRMLETGKYLGYFSNGVLTGVAGIHVYSAEYKIAALGNIATHPDYRNRQIAFKLTSNLCHELKKDVDFIGLNVRSNNIAAIRCYEKIGFEAIGTYEECLIKNN